MKDKKYKPAIDWNLVRKIRRTLEDIKHGRIEEYKI